VGDDCDDATICHGGVDIRGDVGIDSCCDCAWARLMYWKEQDQGSTFF
jgi:hypothetical protein